MFVIKLFVFFNRIWNGRHKNGSNVPFVDDIAIVFAYISKHYNKCISNSFCIQYSENGLIFNEYRYTIVNRAECISFLQGSNIFIKGIPRSIHCSSCLFLWIIYFLDVLDVVFYVAYTSVFYKRNWFYNQFFLLHKEMAILCN